MLTKITKAKKIYTHYSNNENIEVWEIGRHRWMTFGKEVQSIIDLDEPGQLPAPFSRAMLASLMFVETPVSVLLIGMGGGSIARYFHNRDVNIKGDVIEWSATVVDIARKFFDFPDEGKGWKIFNSDARDYLKTTNCEYEMILVDISEDNRAPAWISNTNYLMHFKRHLALKGVVVFNLLIYDENTFSDCLLNIRQVFEQRTVCLTAPGSQNTMVFAFNEHPRYGDIEKIKARVPYLQQKWGLRFEEFLERLCIDNPVGSGVL